MFEHVRYLQKKDPARPTFLEVIFAYNGFHAVCLHRLNHALWNLGLRAPARFLANITRILTGIEIHPEARLGKFLFIDHGTGVVIGQTAIVGDEVTIYHGVTLGGISDQPGKRHPTVENGAVIGSGAQVLGNIKIGENARVGANSVVLKDVPADCTVVGNPARLVHCEKGASHGYGIGAADDPVAEAINGLMRDVQALKERAGLPEKAASNDDDYADRWSGSGI